MGDFQAYIDSSLIGSGNMHSATILGKADASYWAYGGDHVPQPDEAAHIVACLKDADKARAEGIKIAGQKYFVLRAEEDLIYCKLGSGGACIAGSVQAVTLGVYGEGTAPPACNKTVEDIAKYLKDNQY